jgi:hypothetical protein
VGFIDQSVGQEYSRLGSRFALKQDESFLMLTVCAWLKFKCLDLTAELKEVSGSLL